MERRFCCNSSTSITCCLRLAFELDPFSAGVLALTLNYSAYISEVYRGGIQAIRAANTTPPRRSA